MQLTIFGATGATGKELVGQALAQGHRVTCLVRKPEIAVLPPEAIMMPGNVRDASAVSRVVAGSEAVFSALGPRSLTEKDLLDRAMANILAGMNEHGVRRLIVLGAAGVFLDGVANQGWALRLGIRIVRATVLKYPFSNQAAQERRLRSSDIDYTIIRPPEMTNAPRSGQYRVDAERLPPAAKFIPRADVAEFMLKQLHDYRFLRRGVYIAG